MCLDADDPDSTRLIQRERHLPHCRRSLVSPAARRRPDLRGRPQRGTTGVVAGCADLAARCVWAAMKGRALPGAVAEPLFEHFGIHVKLLIALPALVIGEAVAHGVSRKLIPYFRTSGVVADRDADRVRRHPRQSGEMARSPGAVVDHGRPRRGTQRADGPRPGFARADVGGGGAERPAQHRLRWLVARLGVASHLPVPAGVLDVADRPGVPRDAARVAARSRSGADAPGPCRRARVSRGLPRGVCLLRVCHLVHRGLPLGARGRVPPGHAPVAGADGRFAAGGHDGDWPGAPAGVPAAVEPGEEEGTPRYAALVATHGRLVRHRWILGESITRDEVLDAPELGPAVDASAMFDQVERMRAVRIGPARSGWWRCRSSCRCSPSSPCRCRSKTCC